MAAATTAGGVSGAKSPQTFAELPFAAKLLVMVLMLFFISAVYYFVLHQSLSEEIESAQSQHQRLETEMVQANQRHQEFLRLTRDVADREALDRQNKRILPERAEIPSFLQDLNRTAELSGLSLELVHPAPEAGGDHYVKLPIDVAVTGRYHQFAKFFYAMSQIERAVSMENVSLRLAAARGRTQPQANTNGTLVPDVPLRMTVLATTYRRADAAPPPGPGGRRTSPPRSNAPGGHR